MAVPDNIIKAIVRAAQRSRSAGPKLGPYGPGRLANGGSSMDQIRDALLRHDPSVAGGVRGITPPPPPSTALVPSGGRAVIPQTGRSLVPAGGRALVPPIQPGGPGAGSMLGPTAGATALGLGAALKGDTPPSSPDSLLRGGQPMPPQAPMNQPSPPVAAKPVDFPSVQGFGDEDIPPRPAPGRALDNNVPLPRARPDVAGGVPLPRPRPPMPVPLPHARPTPARPVAAAQAQKPSAPPSAFGIQEILNALLHGQADKNGETYQPPTEAGNPYRQ